MGHRFFGLPEVASEASGLVEDAIGALSVIPPPRPRLPVLFRAILDSSSSALFEPGSNSVHLVDSPLPTTASTYIALI
eukprot:gene8003-1229_t